MNRNILSPIDLGQENGDRRRKALEQLARAGDHYYHGDQPSIGKLICEIADRVVLVTSVETRPELDPYHSDTGQSTYTELIINPGARRVCIAQGMDTGATDADVWHNRVLSYTLDFRPDETETETFLISPDGQELLARICDGHEADWDGNNHVGSLNLDAHKAVDALIDALADLNCREWALWSVEDWLQDPADINLTADWSDADIERVAAELETEALADGYVLHGDMVEYITQARDEARH
jgi:hypothetical protein